MLHAWSAECGTEILVVAVQWAGSLFRELDYTKEAANGVRFRELYSRLEVGFPGACQPHTPLIFGNSLTDSCVWPCAALNMYDLGLSLSLMRAFGPDISRLLRLERAGTTCSPALPHVMMLAHESSNCAADVHVLKCCVQLPARSS